MDKDGYGTTYVWSVYIYIYICISSLLPNNMQPGGRGAESETTNSSATDGYLALNLYLRRWATDT